jgi:hypothetical protein
MCRRPGLSDEKLPALPRYRSSSLFTDREKRALDYPVAVMRTPVEVTDERSDRMKEYFMEKQMVEIAGHLTLVNLNRLNAAFAIGSAGFSNGMVCLVPDRPAVPTSGSVLSDTHVVIARPGVTPRPIGSFQRLSPSDCPVR